MISLKKSLLSVTVIFIVQFSHAQMAGDIKEKALNIAVGPQFSSGNLTWSIADASGTPNVLSELKFRNIQTIGGYLGLAYRPIRLLSLNAAYNAAKNTGGTVNDKDYSGNNRTNNSYNETFDSRHGNAQEFTGGINFHLIENKSFQLHIGAGYLFDKQLYTMTRKDIAELNSTYNTTWTGGYAGVGLGLYPAERFDLHVQLRYSVLHYKADADWNNIPAFQHPLSFQHNGNGGGFNGGFECRYHLSRLLYLGGDAVYDFKKISNGRDRAYTREQDPQGNYTGNIKIADTRLNEAKTNGIGLRLGIGLNL